MSDTTDALESLIASPGWRILCDLARAEWMERERVGVRNVVSTSETDPVEKLRQIVAAREAVEWVLKLPSEEIAKLKRQESEPSISGGHCRPPTLPMVARMSRRGSL